MAKKFCCGQIVANPLPLAFIVLFTNTNLLVGLSHSPKEPLIASEISVWLVPLVDSMDHPPGNGFS